MPADPTHLLGHIPGVVRARVDREEGGPGRVEVIADAHRPASAVARDVRSALAAACGLDVGLEGVRVVRLGALDETAPDLPAVESVTLTRTESGFEVRVRVGFAGQVAEGLARSSLPDPRFEAIAAARATLHALAELLGEGWFGLYAVSEAAVGDWRVVVAGVEARRGEDTTIRFGLAPAVESTADAAARATVRALVSRAWV